ncbi:hypothetical protein FBU59_005022, partial [Linderina macrospora]
MQGQQEFARLLATIPYSFSADSDVFSGYGSYPQLLQHSPVFHGVGAIGSKYFALFQGHTTPGLAHGEHGFYGDGYHSLKRLGPFTALLSLDTRTNRTVPGIIDRSDYDTLFHAIHNTLPATVRNLVVVAGPPVVFPHTSIFEQVLRSANSAGLSTLLSMVSSKHSGRSEMLGKGRFGESLTTIKFNEFWASQAHSSERQFLVSSLQEFAKVKSCRVTFVSGHVNSLSSGHFYTFKDTKYDPRRFPEQRGFMSDYRSMIQITVSGLVQAPVDYLTHKAYSMACREKPFDNSTGESMYKTFEQDVNGTAPPSTKILARRGYIAGIESVMDNNGKQDPGLIFFVYAEHENSVGTGSYMINVPPLNYTPPLSPHQAPAHTQYGQPGAPLPPPQQQMRPAMSYRDHGAPVGSTAVYTSTAQAPAVPAQQQQSPAPPQGKADHYDYDIPGYTDAGASLQNQPPPPPYSPIAPQQQPAAAADSGLPPRTVGSYTSSYEHTAAWVQQQASTG